MNVINEIKAIFTGPNLLYLFGGLKITFMCAFGVLAISMVFGTAFALLKTYGGRIFSTLVTIYVEIFRNTPILMWICVCFIAMPFSSQYMRAASGLCFVSTAVFCEIVRSGLNSVGKGQIEAGKSQGLNLWQIIYAIIIPQCFRRIIPNIISQMVSVMKDSSYLGQVAIAEFLYCAKKLTATSNLYTGHAIVAMDAFLVFGFAALVYLCINLALSCIVRYMQKKLKFAA